MSPSHPLTSYSASFSPEQASPSDIDCPLVRGWANISLKGQIMIVLGFTGHAVSVATTPFCQLEKTPWTRPYPSDHTSLPCAGGGEWGLGCTVKTGGCISGLGLLELITTSCWLTTAEIPLSPFWGPGCQIELSLGPCSPSRLSGRVPPAFSSPPGVPGRPGLMAHQSNLCLCLLPPPPPPRSVSNLSPCLSVLRIIVTGFRVHRDNPG